MFTTCFTTVFEFLRKARAYFAAANVHSKHDYDTHRHRRCAANGIDASFKRQKNPVGNTEPRGVEVPGYAKANFHDIPDAPRCRGQKDGAG
jgi:hypothetical protein